jgi:hypothetical protein
MKKLSILLFVLLGVAAGCSIPDDYVQADRDTFMAIAPEYASYVSGDQRLDDEQRQRRMLLIDSWRIRLEKAEAAR